jgi:hypothetical protein
MPSENQPLNSGRHGDYGSELESNSPILIQDEKNEINTDGSCACCYCSCCCCSCWFKLIDKIKQFRFEMLIVVLLLCILAVPSYFVIKMVNSDFDYHKECVECFQLHKNNFGFNQTNQECIFIGNFSRDNNNQSINQDEIVLSAAFCGAPECQKKQLLPGVRTVPYWLLFVSTIFAIVISILVNFLKDVLILPMKKGMYDCCGWELKKPTDLISKLCDDECTDFEFTKIYDDKCVAGVSRDEPMMKKQLSFPKLVKPPVPCVRSA